MAERELGALIRKLREERGLTQGQLTEYAKVKRSWLSLVETGKRKRPERELLEKIAVVLHIPSETLLAEAGYRVKPLPAPPRRTPQEILRELEAVTPILVPETTQPASAGAGALVEAEYWPYLPQPGERGHTFIAVPVTGDCMEPRIKAGERVIVDKSASPKPGDVVLAIHDEEAVVKILEQRNGKLYLVALKRRPPKEVTPEMQIIGVVKMVMHRP